MTREATSPTWDCVIVGAGPAGIYAADILLKAERKFDVSIDLFDHLPAPYGLVRSGVAPDHQSLKAVAGRFEKVATDPRVRFVGNVTVGRDVSVAELLGLYDAAVLATGAPADRPLGIPGADLPGVVGSAAFVGWYNGHPDFADMDPPLDVAAAAVIGNGNVALDVSRILAKTRDEFAGSDIVSHALDALDASAIRRITIVGRRGPRQIGMTPKELGELAHLHAAAPIVDPDDLISVGQQALTEMRADETCRAGDTDFVHCPLLMNTSSAGVSPPVAWSVLTCLKSRRMTSASRRSKDWPKLVWPYPGHVRRSVMTSLVSELSSSSIARPVEVTQAFRQILTSALSDANCVCDRSVQRCSAHRAGGGNVGSTDFWISVPLHTWK